MLSHYLCVTVFGSFRQRYVCYDSFILLLDFWVEALKKKLDGAKLLILRKENTQTTTKTQLSLKSTTSWPI